MAKVCDVCKKGKLFGKKVSHSKRRANRSWAPNLKRIKVVVDGTPKTLTVCTRCIRSGKVTRAL